MSTVIINPTRKVTISLPSELVAFTDLQAKQSKTNRSQFISSLLSKFKMQEEERLAIEGYKFYAQEAIEFAEATSSATEEAFNYAQ